MISLTTVNPPECLSSFAAKIPVPKFNDRDFIECKRQVRSLLLRNQHHQCAYCESPITNDGNSSHLDHIESQNDNEARRFDITNLVAACQKTETCGHGHGSDSVPAELNPYVAACLHEAFHCSSDGKLSAKNLPTTAETFAFEKLNLNTPGLKSQRALVISHLMQQTISLGENAPQQIKNLSNANIGFRSLYFQILGRYGFPTP
jgi:uncharacterized protein (TIGR02646 family)